VQTTCPCSIRPARGTSGSAASPWARAAAVALNECSDCSPTECGLSVRQERLNLTDELLPCRFPRKRGMAESKITNLAFGIEAARRRPSSKGAPLSWRQCRTSVGADTFRKRSTISISATAFRFLIKFSIEVDMRRRFAYHLICSVEAPGYQMELNILRKAESSSPHPDAEEHRGPLPVRPLGQTIACCFRVQTRREAPI
jgi:hypothetical protein